MSNNICFLSPPRTKQPSQPETPYDRLRNAVQAHAELAGVAYPLREALSPFGKGLDLIALSVEELNHLVENGADVWEAWKAQATDKNVPLTPIVLAGSAKDFDVALFEPLLREGERLVVEYDSPPDIVSTFKPAPDTPLVAGHDAISLRFVSQPVQPEVAKPLAVTQPKTLPQPTVAEMLLKRLDASITLRDGEGILYVAAEIATSSLLTPSEKHYLLLPSSPCRLDPTKVLGRQEAWIERFNLLILALGGDEKG